MKKILLFLLLTLPVLLYAQYPATGNKQRLGWQTTGDGLVYRGAGLPSYTPTTLNNAYTYIDTNTGRVYRYSNGAWRDLSSEKYIRKIDETILASQVKDSLSIYDWFFVAMELTSGATSDKAVQLPVTGLDSTYAGRIVRVSALDSSATYNISIVSSSPDGIAIGDSLTTSYTLQNGETAELQLYVFDTIYQWRITFRRSFELPADNVTGSGTTNYIPKFTGTYTLGNSNLTDNGTILDALLPIRLKSYTTVGLPTGAQGYTLYNTTANNIGFHTGSAYEYPVKSASATGLLTTNYGITADANGRLTSTSIIRFANNNLGVNVTPASTTRVQIDDGSIPSGSTTYYIFQSAGRYGNASAQTGTVYGYFTSLQRRPGAGNMSNAFGYYATVTDINTTGSISGAVGGRFDVTTSATMTSPISSQGSLTTNPTGTFGTARSFYATLTNNGTTTLYRGLDVETPTGSGTITTAQGLRIGSFTGTNRHAIYVEGGNSYHAGNFGIGSGNTSPSATLDIAGDLKVSTRTGTATKIGGWDNSNVSVDITESNRIGIVSGAIDLKQNGATSGQVLAWNGSAYAPATPSYYTGFTPAADATVGDNIASGDTLTFSGGYGINTSVTGATVTIEADTSQLATQYDLTQLPPNNVFTNDGTITDDFRSIVLKDSSDLYINNENGNISIAVQDLRDLGIDEQRVLIDVSPTAFNRYYGVSAVSKADTAQSYAQIYGQTNTNQTVIGVSSSYARIAGNNNSVAFQYYLMRSNPPFPNSAMKWATDGTPSWFNLDTVGTNQNHVITRTIVDGDGALPDSTVTVNGTFNAGYWRVPESMDGYTLTKASFGIFDKGDMIATGATYSFGVQKCNGSNMSCSNSSNVNFTPSSETELELTLSITLNANDILRVNYQPPQGCGGGCGTENVNGLVVTYTIQEN